MKLLLDTHAFIWWDSDSAKLSQRVREACESPSNSVHLSVASIWEMQIKQMLGKLQLRVPLHTLIEDHRMRNGMVIENITLEDVLDIEKLAPIHRDPFDRMLVAQALRGDFDFVTFDETVRSYGVRYFW